jgi:hypothetical protein
MKLGLSKDGGLDSIEREGGGGVGAEWRWGQRPAKERQDRFVAATYRIA